MRKSATKINRAQIRALSNPKRLEIYSSLQSDGPATALELAERLGEEELGLYYHLRKMVAERLIAAKSRQAATKPQRVFSALGPFLIEGFDLNDGRNLVALRDNFESLLRAISREHEEAAITFRNSLYDKGLISRSSVRLSKSSFRELRKRLRELRAWATENASERGDRYSASFFVLPVVSKKK